ncbi:MAG TPA: winged helix-turn-helix domain-containing protein, partial [Geminicoccaceae bacterium]|nr:winged helix-turn-helix domain-containing protein [Geminicoccaceae bacterium]
MPFTEVAIAKRALSALAPGLELERGGAVPLHRQIYFAIRQAILAGVLRPGVRLPATRGLARQLAVSRNTVMTAFEQLHAEGYVDGRVGAGSFVSRRLPEVAVRAPARAGQAALPRSEPPGPSSRGASLAGL